MAHHSPGWGCSLQGGALNVNPDDGSLDEKGFNELLRPGTFFRNVTYVRYNNNLHKAIFSLKYTYVNNLFGATAQSETFQETRKPFEVIVCLIIGP